MSTPLTRRPITTLLALAGACAALAGVPAGCSSKTPGSETTPAPSGPNVGDPCIPPDELDPAFGGFDVDQEYIVAGDYLSCQTGICLVNHFQGRSTCPLGQVAPPRCNGPTDHTTCLGGACVGAPSVAEPCDPAAASPCGNGRTCDPAEKVCKCSADAQCGQGAVCDSLGRCLTFVCSAGPAACQHQGLPDVENQGKACCVAGTGTPVTVPVCGQCDAPSHRNADQTIYCSCRCAPAAGAPPEPGAKLCTCPTGFVCSEIRKYLGVGDPSLAGSYCIHEGTQFTGASACGQVHGNANPAMCAGVSAGAP